MRKPDFQGWASKSNVLCSDGTTIRDGCFDQQDGEQVPLCYMHNHDEVGQVLGHAILHCVPGGTRVDGYFNDTEGGQTAKELLRNGDINSLSIWANKLIRRGGDIFHGVIKEVSLVIGGADPEARIDTVLAHGDISDDEAEIWGFGAPEIYHADASEEEDMAKEDTRRKSPADNEDDDEETVKDVFDTLTDKQKKAVAIIISQITSDEADDEDEDEDEDVEHAEDDDDYDDDEDDEDDYDDSDDYDDEDDVEHAEDDEDDEEDETVEDVINTLTPKQKKVVDFLIGKALETADEESDEEDDNVKHNVFEDYGAADEGREYISHDDMTNIMELTQRTGKLSQAFDEYYGDDESIAHADQSYGIENIDYLFPEAKMVGDKPEFIKRDTGWVDKVLSSVHKTPFSRVKSVLANITEDEARAKGYIKGKLKKEEVFSLLKRVTPPQTIYKKQKLDKDDIDDITEFDVVAWVKAEMQIMLREEVARAILIGDGRLASDEDKIKEENIRPVFNDSDLYTIKFPVEIPENATDDQKAKALLKAQLKARKLYKGSGNMTFYTKEDELTNVLLLENGIGERMYKSEAEVATAMRVSTVQPIEVMDGLQIEVTGDDGSTKTKYDVAGVDVNLADYNIGTNGGAKTDFFDDFDLNYNQQICLYETRMSGALVKPLSAITFYYKPVKAAGTGA